MGNCNRKCSYSNDKFDDVLIVWLNSIDEDESIRKELNQIMIYSVKIFFDEESCRDFVRYSDVNGSSKIFLILNQEIHEDFLDSIHDLSIIESIYIYSKTNFFYLKNYSKLNENYFSKITKLCQKLNEDICHYQNNLLRFDLIKSQSNKLDADFMYSLLLKETLIQLDYDQNSREDFLAYCRQQTTQFEIIDELKNEYEKHSPIWWYTRESFIYHFMNKALRTENIDLLLSMGFFLRDLHEQIVRLHRTEKHSSMIVYRGQGLTDSQFQKLIRFKRGLISFQHFLSTSLDKQISLNFARKAIEKPGLKGIIFRMHIDAQTSSSSFASIQRQSFYKNREKEILFSTHTVFTIENIKKLKHENNIWRVDLRLTTNEQDIQLQQLTKHFRDELHLTDNPKESLAQLLLFLGYSQQAQSIYFDILQRMSPPDDQQHLAYIYHQLGCVYNQMNQFENALEYFEKSLELKKNFLSIDDDQSCLAETYLNIGSIYHFQQDFDKAFLFFTYALQTNTNNQKILASIYNNIGIICKKQSKFHDALEYFNQSLQIDLNSLPQTHPDLAITYFNIGKVYLSLQDYVNAFTYLKKTLDIRKLSLPTNHPDLMLTIANYQHVQSLLHHHPQQQQQQQQINEYQQVEHPNQRRIRKYKLFFSKFFK